ncbi:MAG: CmcJ/NvfI family oxidoreductase, partial [Pseudomonadota bacterium]
GAANKDGNRRVASRIHVDYTAKSGPQRARDVLGSEAFDQLLAKGARIVQVNVWRPIVGPVQRAPLALADASTVEAVDLIATDQVFPNRVGEIYHLTHNLAQKWYFAPEMTPDEVLLIKGWDSVEDGRAQFTPHTAFPLPNQDGAPARESIEVRTLVVIE